MHNRPMARWCVALLALFLASPAAAQSSLTQDAAAYAAQHGLEPTEALSRLNAIEASHALTDGIARQYADRLAGISVVHAPDLRIRVLLTGKKRVRPTSFTAADGRVVPVVIRTHHASEKSLRRAVRAIDRLLVVRARSTAIRIEETPA